MEEVKEQRLYTMMVNGNWLIHPKDHYDVELRGKTVKMNGIVLREIVHKMLNEKSPNEVGENFQIFRVQ